MKHTKGPWSIKSNGIDARTITATFPALARVHYETDEDKANARLIAAAPDLLSACQIVLNNLTTMIPSNRDLQALGEKACIATLKAAITKAEGAE